MPLIVGKTAIRGKTPAKAGPPVPTVDFRREQV